MVTISGIVLAKNSESMIADCLDTLSFCDEIIVIDDGSSDRTVDLARRMGAKVFVHSAESFAEKRNFGLSKAKGEWVLYLDSDERVSAELRQNIQDALREGKHSIVAFRILRKNFYFGNHEWPNIEKLERLFKKSALKEWRGEVHETPVVEGKIGDLEGYVLHYTHRDLSSMVKKTIEWSKIEAELRFKNNHPQMSWWRFFRVMGTGFFDSYVNQRGYKAGTAGLVESLYQAFSMFITYARLWEMQSQTKNKNEKFKTIDKV